MLIKILNQQIELIKNELIRYLLFADCGDAVFEDQVDVFAEEINKFIEEENKMLVYICCAGWGNIKLIL